MDPITLNAQVRLNDVEETFDGGRLLLHCDDAQVRAAGWTQVEVILNAPTDDKLAQFPSTKAEKLSRVFEVSIREVTA